MAGNSEKQRKNLGRPFPKGVSGNPSGLSAAARELSKALAADAPEARKRLFELLNSDNDKVALEAAKFIIDHVKGKAPQAITGLDGGPLQVDLGVLDMLRKLASP